MRILYIYPHPDDESFGPSSVMAKQRRQGHEVYLLTLTKGGATKVRHQLGLSVEEMGEVRHREVLCVAKVLDLNGFRMLDLPDSGLKEMDPRDIEQVIADEIRRVRPHVIVGYAVYGVSGFHDHLVAHAVIKRVFVELRDEIEPLQRFAMVTLTEEQRQQHADAPFALQSSTPEEIDCMVEFSDEDAETKREGLRCYKTYQEVIEKVGMMRVTERTAPFEIFGERHDPPLDDLFAGLRDDS